ncbi:MAG: hypothetical protein H6660_15735 [Ardenticatenaceae bacterium]|nr:hypothetical protein [Ardenticatenaceae bacterium]
MFTAVIPDRDNGTGKWTIRSAEKLENDELLEGDVIYLDNGYPNTGSLVAYGNVTQNEIFKQYEGQQSFVFTSTSAKRKSESGAWAITLSNNNNSKLVFDFFGPELLQGRTHNMKGVMSVTNILLNDALQAVGGISIEEVKQLLLGAEEETKEEGDQRLKNFLDKATSGQNQRLSDVIDHSFQIKQLLNLFALSNLLNAFNQNTLQALMLKSSQDHQQNKTLAPLHLFRGCFRCIAADHEIIQRATVQRRWNQDKLGEQYYQSEQAVELLVMDKLAIKAVAPFQHLLFDHADHLAVLTYFSETTHIHHVPYTDRFILVGVNYDRVSLVDNSSDDKTLTGRDFSAFELMAIPHEVGHYVYQHGKLENGKTFPEVSQKFKDNPYYQWCEEIFADLYGCIVAGPLSVFSMQAFLTSGDKERAWRDDNEHPTPILRSYILSEILRILRDVDKKGAKRYDFATVTRNLDEGWTEILEGWGYERIEKDKNRPTRIYLPDDSTKHLERIINVDRVIKAIRPIIAEFANHLLAAANFNQQSAASSEKRPTDIPWSKGDYKVSKEYAREMAALAGGSTAREPISLEVLLNTKMGEDDVAHDAADAEARLQWYLDIWGDSGPTGSSGGTHF